MIMKRFFLPLLVLLLLTSSLAGCVKDDPEVKEDVYFTVTFDTAGGTAVESVKVLEGSLLVKPENPKKDGFLFTGWKLDTRSWIFSADTVKANITLTATWIDALSVFSYKVNDNGQSVTVTEYKGNSLSDIEVPTSLAGMPVTAIGSEAFSKLNSDTVHRVTVPESITIFEEYAFYRCADIEIVLMSKPTSLGEKAFYGCNKLTSVKLGEGLENVAYMAFGGCTALESVMFPSTLKTIEENAFEYCGALKTLTIHDALESVGDSAFLEADSLKAIYYYGDDASFEAIEIAEGNNGNDALFDASLFLYSEAEPADGAENKYWHYDNDGNVRIW